MDYKCTNCGAVIQANPIQLQHYRKTGRIYCTPKCGYAYRDAHRKPRTVEAEPTPCSWCGGTFEASGYQLTRKRKGERTYCSKGCSTAYRSKVSSETMTRTNKKHASARMTERNPMHREEVRAKVSRTLKQINHGPKIRGGNGQGPTEAEAALAVMLAGLGFEHQIVIRTGATHLGYPHCYKPDLGNWSLKIAIEADGPSHSTLARQEQDRKKDAFLTGLGWTVLRFSNRQILTQPGEVLGTVMSTISRLKASTLTSPMGW
jgi:very-short-patch-repair endonuclease